MVSISIINLATTHGIGDGQAVDWQDNKQKMPQDKII